MNNELIQNEHPEAISISKTLQNVGIVIILLCAISTIGAFTLLGDDDQIVPAMFLIISSVLFGLVFSVPLFALAAIIKLVAKIEINSRYYCSNNENTNSINSNETSVNNPKVLEEILKKKTINDIYASKTMKND